MKAEDNPLVVGCILFYLAMKFHFICLKNPRKKTQVVSYFSKQFLINYDFLKFYVLGIYLWQ